MPALSTVFLWLLKDECADFSEQYTRADQIRAQAMFEDMIEIASQSNEAEQVTIKESDKGIFRDTKIGDNVQRSDLHVRTLQWALARMSPKKYGDKMQLEQKVDITKHYVDDDEAILKRHAEQYAAAQSRKKSNPQGDANAKGKNRSKNT